MDDVNFTTDPFNSQYLGDSAAAATMPNLKGFGTLTDLQVAMTLDPTLIDVVNATLPNLTAIDLSGLRQTALPIFAAWPHAVPLLDAEGKPQIVDSPAGHTDIPFVYASNGTDLADFAYQGTDDQHLLETRQQ
jgi:hypothetical protein